MDGAAREGDGALPEGPAVPAAGALGADESGCRPGGLAAGWHTTERTERQEGQVRKSRVVAYRRGRLHWLKRPVIGPTGHRPAKRTSLLLRPTNSAFPSHGASLMDTDPCAEWNPIS